jgi:hypothetical protein
MLCGVLAAPVVHAQSVARDFAIRSDPSRAPDVERVLGQIAQPSEIKVTAGEDIEAALKERCGGEMPQILQDPSANRDTVVFRPCLRSDPAVTVTVTDNQRLEKIVQQYGLHPNWVEKLKPHTSSDNLHSGDKVTIPRVPRWTPFTAKPEWGSREAVSKALADGLGCGSESAEACLMRLRVLLIDRGPPSTPTPTSTPAPTPTVPPFRTVPPGKGALQPPARPPLPPPQPGRETQTRSEAERFNFAAEVSSAMRLSSTPVAPPLAMARSSISASAPRVAEKQWPYDLGRVRALLAAVAPPQSRTTIGVADIGLHNREGAPLPKNAFGALIGAGVPRTDDELRSRDDVSLCGTPPPPNVVTWSPEKRRTASHGSIVASIAAGLNLYGGSPSVVPVLPQLVFYRTVANACSESSTMEPHDDFALVDAFDYLVRKDEIQIMNFSVGLRESNNRDTFVNAVRLALEDKWTLLIVPAGNDRQFDPDTLPPCPACLADTDAYGPAGRRVIVVGAATNSLEIASYSGSHDRIVRLYAPGEPVGSVYLDGADAGSAANAATSAAAPLVALAVAITKSLGPVQMETVKHRMMLATWPLLDEMGQPVPSGARVLDLTKAAAIRTYAVEAWVDENSKRVRRTFVGDLITPLEQLSLCGTSITPTEFQALRFESVGTTRRDIGFTRELEKNGRGFKQVQLVSCRPMGTLRINDLISGEVELPLKDVTQILVPWKV